MAARKLTENLWEAHKRQSIQDAVVRLMCREGVAAVTMERVAHEVGIAKGTVYLYYETKQHLLEAVKESSLEPLRQKAEEILAGPGTPEKKLKAFPLRYLTYFDERRDLFRILLYDREAPARSVRYQSKRYHTLIEEIARVIGEGTRSGAFRKVDTRSVAAMFLDSNIALVNHRLLTDAPAPVEDAAALVSDIFLRGLKRAAR
ncbi:MAG: TetR/AcrR family transcriptional regulator [Thermoanaerobaculia bacterium]